MSLPTNGIGAPVALGEDLVLAFGGTSGERRVSVATAQHLAEALALPDEALWYVAPDGSVFGTTRVQLAAHQRPFELDFLPSNAPLYPSLEAAFDALVTAKRDPVVLLGFHGGAGEDGTVQAMLEARGLAFVGSGARASALAMQKAEAKRVARAQGVATADAELLDGANPKACLEALRRLLKAHGRAVAKPVADGSSVGLFHVRSEDEARAVADAIAARAGTPYMAEAFLAGTELTVGVYDAPGHESRALAASEVRLDDGHVFDFEGKYLGRGTTELTPAQVPEAVSSAARALAVTMHRALGCFGYSRTDVIATERGPYFLETNTLPGMTRASFLPQQLSHAGLSVRDFFAAQVQLARARQRGA